MEPEPTPSSGKKFLKILLAVLTLFFLLAGTAYILTALKNAGETRDATTGVNKVYPEEEKLRFLNAVSSTTPTVTSKDEEKKLRFLQNSAKNTPMKSTASSEEKLHIIEFFNNQ